MPSLRALAASRRTLERFATSESGVSAVEFALVLPVMLTMYLGTVEVTQAIAIDRKMTLVASTIADLAAQGDKTISPLSYAQSAAADIVLPFDKKYMTASVSVITVNPDTKQVTVVCSNPSGAYGSTNVTSKVGDLSTFISNGNTTLIWSEAKYTYTPAVGYVITGSMTLSDSAVMALRGNSYYC